MEFSKKWLLGSGIASAILVILCAFGLPLVEIQQRLVGATDAELRRVAGLPDDLAEYRSSMPQYSDATVRAYAETSLRLLGECQEQYLEVAALAQGHYNDWRTLSDAWPKLQTALPESSADPGEGSKHDSMEKP